ncbi:g10536 [Coccomyxa elongata]
MKRVNGPSVYRSYLAAAQNLGLSDAASGYWELHIKEDERHGRQMVDDVALPLVDMYPQDAWEVLLGYVQERMMGERAGAALIEDIKVVDAQAGQ